MDFDNALAIIRVGYLVSYSGFHVRTLSSADLSSGPSNPGRLSGDAAVKMARRDLVPLAMGFSGRPQPAFPKLPGRMVEKPLALDL
jgi:hypothetical protein